MSGPTRITETLWVGAHPTPAWLATEGKKFQVIAFCAAELPPPPSNPSQLRYISVPLTDDDQILKDFAMYRRAERAARTVLETEGPCLCCCAEGRNRSALVAALSLVMAGIPAPDAIGLVRRKRELVLGRTVLFNKDFVHLIRRWKQEAP